MSLVAIRENTLLIISDLYFRFVGTDAVIDANNGGRELGRISAVVNSNSARCKFNAKQFGIASNFNDKIVC